MRRSPVALSLVALSLVALPLVSSAGCSGAPAEPASPPGVEPAAARSPVPPVPAPAVPAPAPPRPAAAPADDAAERAAALAEAEAFVRAQGYADTPPTVGPDQIVHEGIEGTVEDRIDSLDPHPVHVSGASGEWSVIFRYLDARYAGRGRMLRLRPGQPPAFVHQDVLLSAFPPGSLLP